MIDISLAGLLGAVVGTVVAALSYGVLVAALERGLRARVRAASAEERQSIEQETSLLRRVVFIVDIVVFAGVGYWLGERIGG